MERREALESIRFILKKCEDTLQGDRTPEERATMRLIDEFAEVIHINQCVDSLQATQHWLGQEIEKELEREDELLPEEGNPGFLVGQ